MKKIVSALIVSVSMQCMAAAPPGQVARMQNLDCNAVVNASVADCLALRDIYLNNGGASWTGADNWGDNNVELWEGVNTLAGRVTFLGLQHGQSGQLPASIGNLTALEVVHINAPITGDLPASISAWSGIRNLVLLDQVRLNGVIPPELFSLSTLRLLRITTPHFSGSLPDGLSALTALTDLGISRGSYTGSIPTSWSALSNLQRFTLSRTTVSGSIPEFLSQVPGSVEVPFNQLSGAIPDTFGTDLATPDVFRAQANFLDSDAAGVALLNTPGLRAWAEFIGPGQASFRTIGAQRSEATVPSASAGSVASVPSSTTWSLSLLMIVIAGFAGRHLKTSRRIQ
ncbi:hypothetical protein [Pseudoteredinibacter isoporae]|uniref:Uncharacterized protein n=1 Tax=Pseudoteredinibacter isoporae TaxID=570281 RepID=A0A7X0JQG4_9GAMM|nr:hypothetical protein [Pseudoteredinibacter isoporae]MBB6520355.1 hypothetical protein [Pseudoteredinibacter isoporae]NHO85925.1 hypothetical protein [Pseudoteredinibacter isoporae]NIB25623.1 hypothetical protein [Pseudoteredinibacter isoporae]